MKLNFIKFAFLLAGFVLAHKGLAQNAWTETNGPFGGDVRSIKRASNGTLYAIVNQRPFKSTNNADSWTAIATTPSQYSFNDILIDDDGTLYGVYFSNIYTSHITNDNQWTLLNSNSIQGAQYIMSVGSDDVFVTWGTNGLYVSTDKAVSWTQLSTISWSGTPGCWANAAGDVFYATQGGKLFRHVYQGLSPWSSSNMEELTNYEISAGGNGVATVTFDGSNRMYVSSFGDVFISDNNGNSYSSITSNLNAASLFNFDGLLATSSDNTVYLFAADDNNLYKTVNQGVTWTSSNGPSKDYGTPARSIAFASASTFFVGTQGDGVFRTTNTTTSWELKSTGLTGNSAAGIVISDTDRIILIKGFNNLYWYSDDEGATWNNESLPGTITAGLKLSDGTVLLYGSRVFRSTNDGVSFSDDGNDYGDAKIVEASNGDLYGFRFGKVSKSTDQGANWTDLVITGLPSTFDPYEAAIDGAANILCHGHDGASFKTYRITGLVATELMMPNSASLNNLFFLNSKFYATQFTSYFYTPDLGANWTTVGFSGSEVLPLKKGPYSGVAVSKTGGLSITQDDGGTWNSTTTPSSATITGIALNSGGTFFASGTNSALLKYESDLLVDPVTLPPYIDFNWQPLNGPYGGSILRVQAHPDGNTLFAVGNGATLWRYTGGAWERVPQFAAITSLVLDIQIASNGDIYAVAVDIGQLYKSTNKGDSWTHLSGTGLPSGLVDIRGIEILSDGSILAFGSSLGSGKIYKSINGGTSFSLKHTGSSGLLYHNNLAIHSAHDASGRVIAIGGTSQGYAKEGLVYSDDFGETWTVKPFPTIAGNTGVVGPYSFDDTGAIVATAVIDIEADGWTSEIVRSSNDGDSWSTITTSAVAQGNVGKSLVVLPTGEYLLSLSTPFFDTYRSTDHGATWTFVGNFGDSYQSLDEQGGNIYLAGLVKGVQKTTDGTSFTFFNNEMPINSATDVEILNNKDLLVGATSPYYSDDFGQNFSLATSEVAGNFLVESDGVIAYGSRRLQKSDDGGKTWTAIGDDRYFNFLAKDESTDGYYAFSNIVIPGTTVEFGLFYSTDLIAWDKIELSGLPDDYSIKGLVNDSGGGIYTLVADGDSQINTVYKLSFGFAIDITDVIGTNSPLSIKNFNDKILVYDGGGALFKSTDGLTWTQGTAPSGTALIIANDYIFVTTGNSALWLSRDEGVSWQSVGEAFVSGVNFKDVAINEFDGHAYAAISASVVKKSGNIVIPDDGNGPVVQDYFPANGATDVVARPELVLTFDEAANKGTNKKIRVFDLSQPAVPVQVIDVSTTIRNGKSYTVSLTSDLSYLKTYFVIVDPGTFVDIHGNAFDGITSNATWRFTIQEEPDSQKPVIAFTTTGLNLEKATAKSFNISVTDNKVLPTDKTKIWYRGIAQLGSVPFNTADMTVASGSGTTASNFTIAVQEAWYDAMGLEFYFESEDDAGNAQRSPETPDTFYYSYISYPSSANPAFPSGRIAFGGTATSYRVISIPFELTDAQVTTILDEFGSYDKTKWRLYTYAGNNEFTENPSAFERGRGYWINVRNSPGSVSIDGATTPPNNRTDFFTINLSPGWNQIGNPYPVDISWEQVRAANTAEVGPVKIYNGTAYSDGDVLAPYQGGFVLVSAPSAVSLKVRFRDILSGGRKSEVLGTDLSKSNWSIPILAENNSIINTFGGVGMHEDASMTWDEFDDINPPRFLKYAELSFNHKNQLDLPLAKDMVPTQNEFVWGFSTISSGGVTSLSWDNSVITGEADLYLLDMEDQHLIDMKATGSYSFDGNADRSFKIYFGNNLSEKVKPSKITLGTPFPNPSSDRSMISYTIPKGGDIVLEVYNSQGQLTSTLYRGELESGFYTSSWESESVPNGIYFYRLSFMENGKSRSLVEKVIVNR